METGLIYFHNILRYAIVVLLIINLVKSFTGWFGKGVYTEGHQKLSLFLLISAHLQLLIGLALFFSSALVESALADMAASMKNEVLRFWSVEHSSSMLLGIIFITLGRIMGKKGKTDEAKFRRQSVYFLLASIIIFYAIPWPWSAISRPWF